MRHPIRTIRLLAGTALGVSTVALTAAAAELLPVTPPDDKAVIVGGVSADGAVVVGTLNPALAFERSGFVWTQAGGMGLVGNVGLGTTLTKRFTATGVSNDGGVIVGTASDDMLVEDGTGMWARAYVWTSADGFVDLGSLAGSPYPVSTGLGVSGDGRVVVGSAFNAASEYRGFRWKAGEMEDIGAFWAQYPQMAANYDGSVVVGNTQTTMQLTNEFSDAVIELPVPVASFWTEASGQLEQLPLLNGGTQSVARDISDDGRIIVGQAHNGANGKMHAVRWVETNPEDLTTPGSGLGDNYSFAFGVSGNGEVVVGETQVDGTATQRGFRWTEGDGMQTVEDWLRDSGAVILADITYAARATNCDGSVVVGETGLSTVSNQMFIARGNGTGATNCDGTTGDGDGSGDTGGGDTGGGDTGGGDTGGGDTGGGDTGGGDTGGGDTGGGDTGGGTGGVGLIVVDDLATSLADAGSANLAALGSVNLLLNGAGSRPLDRRVEEGRLLVWTGGDIGADDHGASDGAVGLGEVGIGYNFGGLQLNGAIGLSGGHYDTLLGGSTDLASAFVKVEAMGELYATDLGGIWGVITGTALLGTADIGRNYLVNGGAIDGSFGQADLSGFGVRGRLQWENAVPYVSPFGELAYTNACIGAYSETGGAFPAAFDGLCSDALDIRIGVDVRVPVTEELRVIGTLEGVHRLAGDGDNVTGEVIGLGAFDLGAAAAQQSWVRAGLGLEADLGTTTFSVMGNLTTQGQSSSTWIAASLRATF